MEKFAKKTVFLFFLSIIIASAHRVFNASHTEMFNPFIAKPDIPISKHWYYLFLGELLSYSCVWLCVCFAIKPVKMHMQDMPWVGKNPYLVFISVWYNIFWVCFFASLLDTVHFLIGFKRIEWWFLVQTSGFLLISIFFICKSYYHKWPRKKT